MAGSPLSVSCLHSFLACKNICILHISYFSAAVVKHHEQKQLTEGRVCLTCGSEGWESIMGGPAASDKHGSRNGKPRAHIFEHKHEAERVNSKWLKALTYQAHPKWCTSSIKVNPPKPFPANTTKWWTNAHSWAYGGQSHSATPQQWASFLLTLRWCYFTQGYCLFFHFCCCDRKQPRGGKGYWTYNFRLLSIILGKSRQEFQ